METTKLTRNTISISYNLDKTNQIGFFVLSLFKDNQPIFVKDTPTVTYYRKGTADIKTWTPTVKDGFVYLNANDFSDIHKAGTYYITCILSDGDIYPSQGSAILTLEGDLPEASEVQVQPITGANGKDGASIVNIQLDKTQSHFIFTMSNGQAIETSVSMPEVVKGPKGDKGQDGLSAYQVAVKNGFKGNEQEWLQSLKGSKGDSVTGPRGEKGEKGDSIVGPKGQDGSPGKDAPHVTRVTYDNNQLSFTFSDGSSLSTPFIVPTPTNGKDGKDGINGKNAPTIEDVKYDDDTLTFSFSDGSSLSTPFIMPAPKDGKDGKNGTDGKNAPSVTSVSYANDELTFNFSDGTRKSTSFIMPTPKDGKNGSPGKDAPTITSVDLNDNQTQLVFTFSDGTKLQTDFKAPEAMQGPKGDKGQDAPKITSVRLNDDQTKLIFTLSDNSELQADFTLPKPKDGTDGKDAPHVARVTYADNNLSFSFSDGSSLSTPFIMPAPKDGKDGLNAYELAEQNGFKGTLQDWLESLKSEGTKFPDTYIPIKHYDTNYYANILNDDFDFFSSNTIASSELTRDKPTIRLLCNFYNLAKITPNRISMKHDSINSSQSSAYISLKPIFDELDTKANKADVPTNETLNSQIDQNLKEKLKKNIVTKITPPGFIDDTGTRVQSGLAISSYNLNGDQDTMRYTPKQIVALDNVDPGYSYDIPISKLSVNEQFGLVSMVLQGSLTGNSHPKKFSIGKTEISDPDPSYAQTVLSTDNKQGSAYSSNGIQIRDRSDSFSGLPVTVVYANIKEQTEEAREAFKNAFSDFNEKFYFLHIEG